MLQNVVLHESLNVKQTMAASLLRQIYLFFDEDHLCQWLKFAGGKNHGLHHPNIPGCVHGGVLLTFVNVFNRVLPYHCCNIITACSAVFMAVLAHIWLLMAGLHRGNQV